jgi:hypothetical protein
MDPWMLSGVVLSATAAARGLLWRWASARNERTSTDVYLRWMLADVGALAIKPRSHPSP